MQQEPSQVTPCVRGLPLPSLLAGLVARGQWRHPGDDVLRAVLPWFEDPVDFLTSTRSMTAESRFLDQLAGEERTSQIFHVTSGSITGPSALPWLDADRAFVIAVNRNPGDDVAIALDYRGDTDAPAVVASDAWSNPGAYLWRPVAPNFGAFVAMTSPAPA